jgi:hypothetical protein
VIFFAYNMGRREYYLKTPPDTQHNEVVRGFHEGIPRCPQQIWLGFSADQK